MKTTHKLIWLWLLLSSAALAQFTTVTGTVTDPNGLKYAFGTIASVIVSSSTPVFSSNSQPYFQPTQATGLSSVGTFTVRLADNTQLSPGGTTWTFTVCSAGGTVQPAFGKGPICFVVSGVTISGASQDISATLSAAAPALTATTGTGTPCNITNLSVQYDNSGAFGCADLTFATASPLNSFSSPASTWTLGATFAASSSVTEFTANAFPQYSGVAGGAITGANLTATDQSSGNAGGTVSTITGANIQGNGSSSGTGQTTAVSNIFGVNALAKAPAVANVTNLRGGFFQANTGSGTATIANFRAVEGFVNINTGAGGVVTNSADLYARSPSFGVNGTATHHYGLFLEDQSTGGASNPDPHGVHQVGNAPNEFQGHINQIAAGNWAGSCAMAAGTSCTFSITAAYTGTPLSFVSIDAASTPPATAISVKCSVSGTTVTITAGASNSLTWDCLLIGNPN